MTEPSANPASLGAPSWLLAHSETRLARAARRGDQRAFAGIYQRYHQELYRYCRALLGNAHEAQDALQNTMAIALRSLPGEERVIELRPWLYRVAHNEAVSILRRRRPLDGTEDGMTSHEPGADVVFESRERLRSLVSDLARLPERQRAALVMRELSGLSPEQIATALGITSGAARQLVYEARQGLQELAEGRAMECDQVRRVISDGDGRVLRGRRLRSHMRGCQGCSDFKAGIDARSQDLKLVAPPLSVAAASGVLSSVLGGSTGAGMLGGLVGGGGVLGAKSLALLAASAAIGIGAGTAADVDLPGSGSRSAPPPATAPRDSALVPAVERGDTPASTDPVAGRSDDRGVAEGGASSWGQPPDQRGGVGDEQAAETPVAGGASAAPSAETGQPQAPPGSGVADARSDGHSVTPVIDPPEQANPAPPERANLGEAGKGGKPPSSS
jgi:RNA polymerase sigma factor (sigma-70 family)